MHRKETHVDADEEEPGLPASEAFAQHPARHLWKPVEKRRKKRKHGAADQHVMQMGDDEKSVVHLEVDRD